MLRVYNRQLCSEVEFIAAESRRWDYCIQTNEKVGLMVCCWIKGSGLVTFGRNHLPRGTVFRWWYLREKTRVDIFCTHGQHSHLDSHEGFAVLQSPILTGVGWGGVLCHFPMGLSCVPVNNLGLPIHPAFNPFHGESLTAASIQHHGWELVLLGKWIFVSSSLLSGT